MPDANHAQPNLPKNRVWRVGAATFDEQRRELRVGGQLRTVEAKPLLLFETLLARAGDVVTKEELLATVWQGRSTVEQSLTTATGKLREALGDEGRAIIEAVRGVGYRIGLPIELATAPEKPKLAFMFQRGDTIPNRPQWRLDRPLGSGAAQGVWLARHEKTGEQRVFKFADTVERRRALQREAALSRILHNALGNRLDLVRITEWSFESRPAFLESTYGGESLPEWTASRGDLTGIPLTERIAIIARLARTVAAAHDVGVLHRDIKPSNVLVSGEGGGLTIRLVDFGSGRLTEAARLAAVTVTGLGLTAPGVHDGEGLSGTLRYMAPEVVRGGPPTIAADVYALGVLLFQMVVGDFEQSLVIGWESEVEDDILRLDVSAAASGNPSRRLSSASILAERLENIDTRRYEAQQEALRAAERQQLIRDAERQRLDAAASARETVSAYRHANRMRVAASCLAALFGVAAFLAIYGYREQRFAAAQRSRAEQITGVTTSAVSSLVNDITTSLREQAGVPLSVLQQILGQAELILARMSRVAPDDKQFQELHARALSELADVYLHQGNLKDALTAAEQAIRIEHMLLRDNRNDAELKSDLARSERWVGDVKFKRRDFHGAILKYAVALQVTNELLRLDPSNPLYQQRWARLEESLGTVQLAQQQPSEALLTFRMALHCIEKGSPASLATPDWQLDLSTTNERVGDALEAVGDKRGALAAYEITFRIVKKLVSLDNNNVRWLRDLGVAESEMGDEQRALNMKQDALASYQAGLEIGQKLDRMDPANILLQRDVAVGEDEVGNAEADIGDYRAAKDAFGVGIELMRAALLRSPTDENLYRDLSDFESDFAKMLLKSNEIAEAIVHARQADSIIKTAMLKHPLDKELKKNESNIQEFVRKIEIK